jgi:hypothetical protein
MEKEPIQLSTYTQEPMEFPLPGSAEHKVETPAKEEQVSTGIDEAENQHNLEVLREKAEVILKLIEHPGWNKPASKVIIFLFPTRLIFHFRRTEVTSTYHTQWQMR